MILLNYLICKLNRKNLSYQFRLPDLEKAGKMYKFKITSKVNIDGIFHFPDGVEYAYPVFTERDEKLFQKWNYIENPTRDFALVDSLRQSN